MKNNIAVIRKKRGISQKELAEMLEISFWWMNHIESGKRTPSLSLLLKIAEKLGVTPNDIFLK